MGNSTASIWFPCTANQLPAVGSIHLAMALPAKVVADEDTVGHEQRRVLLAGTRRERPLVPRHQLLDVGAVLSRECRGLPRGDDSTPREQCDAHGDHFWKAASVSLSVKRSERVPRVAHGLPHVKFAGAAVSPLPLYLETLGYAHTRRFLVGHPVPDVVTTIWSGAFPDVFQILTACTGSKST